jgi:hypothetical protein
MPTPSARRVAAERYRRVARTITDPRTVEALNELAAKYEAQAAAMEAAAMEAAAKASSVDGAAVTAKPGAGQTDPEGSDVPDSRKSALTSLPRSKTQPQ